MVGASDSTRFATSRGGPIPRHGFTATARPAWRRFRATSRLLAVVLIAASASVSLGPVGRLLPEARAQSGQSPQVVPISGGPLADLVVDGAGHVFASNPAANAVDVVDLPSGSLEAPIPLAPLGSTGAQPQGLALSADGSTLYVADAGTAAVSVVDVATRREQRKISVPPGTSGDWPYSLAAASNGKVLLATTFNGGGFAGRILEIDLPTGTVVQRTDFKIGIEPPGTTSELTLMAASGDHTHIGIEVTAGLNVVTYNAATNSFDRQRSLEGQGSHIALDATGSQIVEGWDTHVLDSNLVLRATIPGGAYGVAISPSGGTAYRVSGSNYDAVDVIDLKRAIVNATISIPETLGQSLGALTISPDGTQLVVTSASGVSILLVSSAVAISCPTTVRGTTPGPVLASICGAPLDSIAVDSTGHAFASNPSRNEIEVFDMKTGILESPIFVGSQPKGLDLTPDGSMLYVADSGAEQISVVNVANRTETSRITVAARPWSLGVASNGKAFFTTTFLGSGFGAAMYQIDRATNGVTRRSDLDTNGSLENNTYLASCGSHDHLGVVPGSDGPIYLYDASTDSFTSSHGMSSPVSQVALDATGAHLLGDPGSFLLDGSGNVVATIPSGGYGAAFWAPGGAAFRAQLFNTNQVDVIDINRARVALSIPLPDALWSALGKMVVNPDGTSIAVLTDHGISLISTLPVVTFQSGPPAVTTQTAASFSFNSVDPDEPEAALTTTCSLDGAPFSACSSPLTVSGLSAVTHTVTVHAADPGSELGGSSYTWRIDHTAPTAHILEAPPDPSTSTSATFAFNATDPDDNPSDLNPSCSLDGSGAAPCLSPVTYGNLSLGAHTFTLRASDSAGNTSGLATYTWTITTTAPSPTSAPPPPPPPSSPSPTPQPTPTSPPSPSPGRTGYWMLDASGVVYAFGNAAWRGNDIVAGGVAASGIAATPSGNGYWVVDRLGTVSAFGDASYRGGNPPLVPGEAVTSISPTPDGAGYWLFSNRGRVFCFGTARSFGDMAGVTLNGPVLGSVATPSGNGYYMVASDGGIFSFGDARFAGSMGGHPLNQPVVGLAPNPSGTGYWLVAADGGIFAFSSPFQGSMGGTRLNQPVIGMVGYGNGYLMVARDGGIFDFSDQAFAGSLGASPPSSQIVAVAPVPR